MKIIVRELKHIFREYHEHDGFNKAAALSFYSIVSLFPILLIVISLAGHYVGESDKLLQKISLFIESILPKPESGNLQDTFVANLKTVVEQKNTFGGFGIFFLFFVAHFLFTNLETTVNHFLHARVKRHFLVTRLLFLVWLSGIALLLFVPSLIDWFDDMLRHWGFTMDFHWMIGGNYWFFFSAFLTFMMAMILIPTHRIDFKNALLGGAIFATLMKIAQLIFRLYTHYSFSRYNLIYGSLTTLILGAIWIFYFSNIFLLCVLWVGHLQKKNYEIG